MQVMISLQEIDLESQSASSPPPLALPLAPGFELDEPELLQSLGQRGRVPHSRKVFRGIHAERIGPDFGQDGHGLTRIFHETPVHEPELEPIDASRPDREVGEDEERRGDSHFGQVQPLGRIGRLRLYLYLGIRACGMRRGRLGIRIQVDVERRNKSFP